MYLLQTGEAVSHGEEDSVQGSGCKPQHKGSPGYDAEKRATGSAPVMDKQQTHCRF